jgi:hypothetical protein
MNLEAKAEKARTPGPSEMSEIDLNTSTLVDISIIMIPTGHSQTPKSSRKIQVSRRDHVESLLLSGSSLMMSAGTAAIHHHIDSDTVRMLENRRRP